MDVDQGVAEVAGPGARDGDCNWQRVGTPFHPDLGPAPVRPQHLGRRPLLAALHQQRGGSGCHGLPGRALDERVRRAGLGGQPLLRGARQGPREQLPPQRLHDVRKPLRLHVEHLSLLRPEDAHGSGRRWAMPLRTGQLHLHGSRLQRAGDGGPVPPEDVAADGQAGQPDVDRGDRLVLPQVGGLDHRHGRLSGLVGTVGSPDLLPELLVLGPVDWQWTTAGPCLLLHSSGLQHLRGWRALRPHQDLPRLFVQSPDGQQDPPPLIKSSRKRGLPLEKPDCNWALKSYSARVTNQASRQ
mmetsp:Transcript_93115/g.259369  ORF Transcript_93115/g.259369 Transcript_93115/m.259369 type:complete len:298 (+) Transcript_93115:440-1333(+)